MNNIDILVSKGEYLEDSVTADVVFINASKIPFSKNLKAVANLLECAFVIHTSSIGRLLPPEYELDEIIEIFNQAIISLKQRYFFFHSF